MKLLHLVLHLLTAVDVSIISRTMLIAFNMKDLLCLACSFCLQLLLNMNIQQYVQELQYTGMWFPGT